MNELKRHHINEVMDMHNLTRGEMGYSIVYYADDVDKVIAEKDAEIARLKDRSLDVKDAAHVLKAFKFYRCQLTHCAYDERTAQWIIDNWEQDYKRIEAYK